MVVDVYKNCPNYENEFYMLRMVNKEDKADLLKVYSDEKSFVGRLFQRKQMKQ